MNDEGAAVEGPTAEPPFQTPGEREADVGQPAVTQTETEALLKAQSELLRITLASIGDAVIATDTQGLVTYLNPVAETMTGWTFQEAQGRDLREVFVIINEETRREVENPVVRVLRENVVVGLANHTLLIARDGAERPIDDTGAPIRNDSGALLGVILVFHDITERMRAERALRESEQKFRLLFANNPCPMWVYDRETLAFLEVNEAATATYGYSRAEFLGMRITDIRPTEEIPRLLEDIAEPRPDFQRSHVWRHRLKDDRIIDVDITSHLLEFAGRAAALVVAQDITARKRLEDERSYIMSSALCLLWWADIYETGGEYLHWDMHFPDTEAAQRFLPLPLMEGERYKDGWYRRRLPEDRYRCDRHGTSSVRAGADYQQDFGCRLADGSVRWLHEDIRVTVMQTGKHWRAVGVCTDITDRRRLENQLLQAQKLESVGRLAGGVAHDFNNLLAVIAGHAELAVEELPADSDALRHLHVIQQAGERAANLTRQLLAFARKQVIEPKVTNLNDLAVGMDEMLVRLIGENIELAMHLRPDLGLVDVDPGQFEQILLNLVVNARDAMPHGGQLTIETDNVTIDEEYAREHPPVMPGDYVMLTISDTGAGMDDAVKGRIFEPFFTTKEQGKGTGLGLATVYGIVKQSNGHIWIYSEPDRGTTFKIYLPQVTDRAATPVEREVVGLPPVGTETVLVVEDEPSLRDLAVNALRRQGYTVLEAGDGEAALLLAAEYPGIVHLLVTDVVMPRMGGRELADRLQALRPGLNALYTSGYTDDAIVQHGVLEAGVAFLQKPFTPAALARKVRTVLDN